MALAKLLHVSRDGCLNAYVEDWVRVFYRTVWIRRDRASIWFMFGGEPYVPTHAQITELLGAKLGETFIHSVVYGTLILPAEL